MAKYRIPFAALAAGLVGIPAAQASVVTVDDSYTPDAVVFTVPAPGVLGNDSSSTGTLNVLSVDIAGLRGTLAPLANGGFTFTADGTSTANTSFRYTASDGAGGTATGVVTLDLVSTLPKANPDSYVLTTPTLVVPVNGVLANDTGGLGGLKVLSASVAGLKGTLTPRVDGSFDFKPNPGLAETTSFSYTLADGAGRTSVATVTIDASTMLPVANADAYTPDAATFTVPAAGLLANDTGGIGGLKVLSASISGLSGILTPRVDGSFDYAANGTATDQTFSYTLIDEVGRTSTASVTLDLTSTLPRASDDVYDVTPGLALDVAALGVLANDGGGIGSLSVLSASIAGLQGTLTPRVDGSFSFLPNPGFTGITSFDYTMVDSAGRSARATVQLRVGVTDPDPPSAVPAPATGVLLAGGLAALGGLCSRDRASRRRSRT